jgi:phage gp36-like protein
MKYITQEQLDAFLNDRSLKALAPSTGASGLDTVLLEKINKMASDKIDGYLRGVYTLPLLEPVDGQLFILCGNLMRYYLYERRGAADMPPSIIELYKLTVKDLEKIQNRTIVLEVTDPQTGEQETAPINSIRTSTPSQKFGAHFTGFDGL